MYVCSNLTNPNDYSDLFFVKNLVKTKPAVFNSDSAISSE